MAVEVVRRTRGLAALALFSAVAALAHAGRPPSDELRNPSFEVGLREWTPLRLTVGSRVDVVTDTARTGARSIRLAAGSGMPPDSGFVAVRSRPLDRLSGGPVTVSAWVRGASPRTRVRIRLDGGVSRTIVVGTEWERISLSGKPGGPSDRHQPGNSFLIALLDPGTMWIDDVQVDVGDVALDTRASGGLKVGVVPEDPVLVQTVGETFAFRVVSNASEPNERVRYRVLDYDDEPVAEGKPDGDRVTFTPEQPGWYRLKVRIERNEKVEDRDSVSFVAVRPGSRADGSGEIRPVAVTTGPRDLELNLERLRRLGIVDVRMIDTLEWKSAEPVMGKWQWPDETMELVGSLGMRPLITLGAIPDWAVKGKVDRKRQHPEAQAPWKRYVRLAAKRYGALVEAWEVWNEPNLLPGKESPSSERVREYAAYVRTAANAIGESAPGALVLAPSSAQRGGLGIVDFERMLAASASWVGGASAHTYRKGFRQGPEEGRLANDLDALRTATDGSLGEDAPLWVTEMGWTVSDDEPPARRRSRYMARAAPVFLAHGVGRVYWFHLAGTSEWSAVASNDMGLLEPGPELAPRRAIAVLATLADQLAGVRGGERVSTGISGVWVYRLSTVGGETVVVAWTTKAEAKYSLVVGEADVRVYDVMNRTVKARVRGGKLALELSRDPLFVRVAAVDPGD